MAGAPPGTRLASLSAGVPNERAMEKAFKAGAYWWQIGEHFGMSQQTAYEPVKRAKKKGVEVSGRGCR